MSTTEDMRKAFDACTVMAGVEPDFECVYMTKGAALLYLDEIDAENAKLRELVSDVYTLHWNGLDCTECPWFDECDTAGGCPWLSIFADRMRDLGVEVDA